MHDTPEVLLLLIEVNSGVTNLVVDLRCRQLPYFKL
jgi:hypothetical protein